MPAEAAAARRRWHRPQHWCKRMSGKGLSPVPLAQHKQRPAPTGASGESREQSERMRKPRPPRPCSGPASSGKGMLSSVRACEAAYIALTIPMTIVRSHSDFQLRSAPQLTRCCPCANGSCVLPLIASSPSPRIYPSLCFSAEPCLIQCSRARTAPQPQLQQRSTPN